MQNCCLSNGSYSLKNCHNPFGKALQPPAPYGTIPVEHLKSLPGASLIQDAWGGSWRPVWGKQWTIGWYIFAFANNEICCKLVLSWHSMLNCGRYDSIARFTMDWREVFHSVLVTRLGWLIQLTSLTTLRWERHSSHLFLYIYITTHQTPRIPYSYFVTKSALWQYLGNQAWYHRSAGVKTTGKKSK